MCYVVVYVFVVYVVVVYVVVVVVVVIVVALDVGTIGNCGWLCGSQTASSNIEQSDCHQGYCG